MVRYKKSIIKKKEKAREEKVIAGAILIAILLIAIGMKVFNSASGVVDSAGSNMSSQEKTMFNKQWDTYSGLQSGSTVKALVSDVISNNSNDGTPDIGMTVTTKTPTASTWTITLTNGSAETKTDQPAIVPQSQYKVTVTMGADGLVNNIQAEQQ